MNIILETDLSPTQIQALKTKFGTEYARIMKNASHGCSCNDWGSGVGTCDYCMVKRTIEK